MRTMGAWAVGGVLSWALACSGERINNVGELNDGGTSGAQVGSGSTANAQAGGGSTADAAGSSNVEPPPIDGGAGGAARETCDVGNGCPFQDGNAITALTASDTKLYWVEHGSTDDLGNFRNDGRLLARAFDSEEVEELAGDLEGPIGVALTTTHVYVFLDQHWDGGRHDALARVPIEGGSAEVVQLDAEPRGTGRLGCECLVHAGATAYFLLEHGIYAVGPEDTQAALLVEEPSNALAVNGDHLYYQAVNLATSDGDVRRVPLAGGASELVSAEGLRHIQISGNYVYALDESGDSVVYLTRMPVTGGPWTRLRETRPGDFGWRLMLSGSYFFHDNFPPGRPEGEEVTGEGWEVIQGSLDDAANARRILYFETQHPETFLTAWVGTSAGVFWTDGEVIRRRDLVVE